MSDRIMEDNFTLRYVLKYLGVNSRAELIPSPGFTPGTALRAVAWGQNSGKFL